MAMETIKESFVGTRAGSSRGSGEIYFFRAPPQQHGRIRAAAVSFYGRVPVGLWCDVKCASCSCHIPSQQARRRAKGLGREAVPGVVGVVVFVLKLRLKLRFQCDSARMEPRGHRWWKAMSGGQMAAWQGEVTGWVVGRTEMEMSGPLTQRRLPSSSPAKHARVGPLVLFLMWGPPGFRGLVGCRTYQTRLHTHANLATRRQHAQFRV